MRLLDLAAPCIITIVDNGHVHRRRSNAAPVRRTLEPPELLCQEYVHRFSRVHRVQEGSWTVQWLAGAPGRLETRSAALGGGRGLRVSTRD